MAARLGPGFASLPEHLPPPTRHAVRGAKLYPIRLQRHLAMHAAQGFSAMHATSIVLNDHVIPDIGGIALQDPSNNLHRMTNRHGVADMHTKKVSI